MADQLGEQFEIYTPAADARFEAIVATFGGTHERAQRFVRRGQHESDSLVFAVGTAGSRIENAAILSRSPGRTAMLLVTPPRNSVDHARGAALIQHAIIKAQELDVVLVQTLVEPMRTDELEMFLSGGMRTIGVLAYMELPQVPAARAREIAPPSDVTLTPWDPNNRSMIERLLEATYVDSLDCPGLSQMRSTSDILDGHLHTGVIDPKKWLTLHFRGVPSGVSLMSEVPTTRNIELVYFGLAANARGRGFGGYLLDASLRVAAELACPIALACDEHNTPALKLYRSRGFSVRLRRSALIAPVPQAQFRDASPSGTSVPTTYPPSVEK